MLSNKPYLVRAFHEWIVDSKCTPFIVINANFPRCKVPTQFVEDGQITLNIAPEAIRDLKIGKEYLEFRASFSGIVHIISAPIKAILSIYAQENGQGMFFDFEEEDASDAGITEVASTPEIASSAIAISADKKKSHLKLVE